jgi:hypothetical protein
MLAMLKRLIAGIRAEPALTAAIAQGLLALIVTRFHLSGAVAAGIESAAGAAAAVLVAVLARPRKVAPLSQLIVAIGTLLAAFSVHWSAGGVSIANAILAGLMLAYTSLRVTPTVTQPHALPEHAAPRPYLP